MLSRDLSLAQLVRLRGRSVYARTGEELGRFRFIVCDERTGQPEFIAIRHGAIWPHTMLVPAGGLVRREDGLRVPYVGGIVRAAPPFRRKEPEESRNRLYRHYRLEPPFVAPTEPVETTLSPAGAVTFRKMVEPFTRRITANLRRETLRVRRVPVYQPVENVTLGSQQVVVTLYDEHPVVSVHVVARERVVAEKLFEGGAKPAGASTSGEHAALNEHQFSGVHTNGRS